MPRSSARQLAISTALEAHSRCLAACNRCGHAPGVRPIVSLARTPRAMLVGQAPGKVETGGGKPFAGRAGNTLFRWFDSIGLDESRARELIYIAAVTRCFPGPHPSGRGDRVPSPRERELCGSWLDDELRIIRPRVLIPVGKLAIERFLGAQPLDAVVGREHIVTHAAGESIVIPLPHPSGASSWIHAPGHQQLLRQSLERIRERIDAPTFAARSVA